MQDKILVPIVVLLDGTCEGQISLAIINIIIDGTLHHDGSHDRSQLLIVLFPLNN